MRMWHAFCMWNVTNNVERTEWGKERNVEPKGNESIRISCFFLTELSHTHTHTESRTHSRSHTHTHTCSWQSPSSASTCKVKVNLLSCQKQQELKGEGQGIHIYILYTTHYIYVLKAGHTNAQGNRKTAQLSSAQQLRLTIFPFDMLSEADLIMLKLIGNCEKKRKSIEEKGLLLLKSKCGSVGKGYDRFLLPYAMPCPMTNRNQPNQSLFTSNFWRYLNTNSESKSIEEIEKDYLKFVQLYATS